MEAFAKKLDRNPTYILPEGYKKIVDKNIEFKSMLSKKIEIEESYKVVVETLDELLCDGLNMHILESISNKVTSYKVRPNIGFKSNNQRDTLTKNRAMSTIIDRKDPINTLV